MRRPGSGGAASQRRHRSRRGRSAAHAARSSQYAVSLEMLRSSAIAVMGMRGPRHEDHALSEGQYLEGVPGREPSGGALLEMVEVQRALRGRAPVRMAKLAARFMPGSGMPGRPSPLRGVEISFRPPNSRRLPA